MNFTVTCNAFNSMNVDSVFLQSPEALYSYTIKTGKVIKYRSCGGGERSLILCESVKCRSGPYSLLSSG